MNRFSPPPPTPGKATTASFLDRYPGYRFVPATAYKMRPNMGARTAVVFITCVCALLAAIFMAYFLAVFILYYIMERWTDSWMPVLAGLFLILSIVNVAGIVVIHRFSSLGRQAFPSRWRRRKGLAAEFDFIESYDGTAARYVFIVKNGRFGLYDLRKVCTQIPPAYDRLEWKTKDATLLATKDGQRFYVDIQGHRLY